MYHRLSTITMSQEDLAAMQKIRNKIAKNIWEGKYLEGPYDDCNAVRKNFIHCATQQS